MITARSIIEGGIHTLIDERPELNQQVNAVLQVELRGEGGGVWHMDLRRENPSPELIEGPHPSPRVAIALDADRFVRLYNGDERWTDAFVRGHIDFRGDLVTALKLRKLFVSAVA